MVYNGSQNGSTPVAMVDVHQEGDHRKIPIDRVGVKDISYPVVVLDRNHGKQHTVAKISMAVNLPHDVKGTHMSRFIEILSSYEGQMSLHTLPVILKQLKERLKSDEAQIAVTFPYFMERVAPESGTVALMDYQCSLLGEVNGDRDDLVLRVEVPVASLCPCSKKISDYGAHNQRGYVTIDVRSTRSKEGIPSNIWVEELVEIAESSASAPVYPLLKRTDERYVTMLAYDNPAFVEDIARGVAQRLENDKRVAWFQVQVVNHESIHSHNVFACVQWTRPEPSQSKRGAQA
ncbi:MAG TPA: GTP cyclohydrolase FolE2 [Dehalococcoidia bacterium]|jgi:GTP cyclohydrolase I|nr:GTP cyclohydrolase FolE2 [Dehalococcoidia bacterium]